jgi:adenine deaminase
MTASTTTSGAPPVVPEEQAHPPGPPLRPARPCHPTPAGPAEDLRPAAAELDRLRRVATGAENADLIIHGGTVAVVHSGKLLRRDVAIAGRYIAAVSRPGALVGRRSLDATGRYILPAYVDTRIRVEQTLLTPGELARLAVATTATSTSSPTSPGVPNPG